MVLEAPVSDKSARIYYGSAASEASIADEECSVISCIFLAVCDVIEN